VIDDHLETFLDAAAQRADGQRLPKVGRTAESDTI
jgi:hypothetical protein